MMKLLEKSAEEIGQTFEYKFKNGLVKIADWVIRKNDEAIGKECGRG